MNCYHLFHWKDVVYSNSCEVTRGLLPKELLMRRRWLSNQVDTALEGLPLDSIRRALWKASSNSLGQAGQPSRTKDFPFFGEYCSVGGVYFGPFVSLLLQGGAIQYVGIQQSLLVRNLRPIFYVMMGRKSMRDKLTFLQLVSLCLRTQIGHKSGNL